jgi:hypothetical protein
MKLKRQQPVRFETPPLLAASRDVRRAGASLDLLKLFNGPRRNSNKPMEAAWSLGFSCSVFRVFPCSFPYVSKTRSAQALFQGGRHTFAGPGSPDMSRVCGVRAFRVWAAVAPRKPTPLRACAAKSAARAQPARAGRQKASVRPCRHTASFPVAPHEHPERGCRKSA